MKKILLSIIIVSTLFLTSHAQFISLGLKAGAQLANISSDANGYKSSGIIGYHGGAFFKLKTPVKFGGKVEALYSARGADIETSTATGNINTETRANFIDVPVLLTFNVIKQLAFEIGPQMSFLVDGESTTSSPIGDVITDYDPDNDPEIGLAVGVDIDLPAKFGAYARYNIGFNKISGVNTSNSYNNSWIQLGIKYRIFEPI